CADAMPGIPGTRRISNTRLSPAADERMPYAILREIAAGVPRSFPFHSVVLRFRSPEFGELVSDASATGRVTGVLLTDSWWVNGRQRSLSACTVVDADPTARKLPPLPPAGAAALSACGKIKRTVQAPFAVGDTAASAPLPTRSAIRSADPEALRKVQVIVADYRTRLGAIAEHASVPHHLPPPESATRALS